METTTHANADKAVIDGFGDEWSRFDQSELSARELGDLFDLYFGIFPWDRLPKEARGFDLGCGSGRWARQVAPRVGKLTCIDASREALEVARKNLAEAPHCELVQASVDEIPLADGSQDFGYSLGVLHHVPDTARGLKACVDKLKPGAPFLLYLYYFFDDRPRWFRGVWKASDLMRQGISRMPHSMRYLSSQVMALAAYYPLARIAWLAEKAGFKHVDSIPLAFYRNRSFYTMRTDALDKFGTRLEQRFTRPQIQAMMEKAGLTGIVFSERPPYWVALGYKAK
jgi:SAM-dependent methyltransferase